MPLIWDDNQYMLIDDDDKYDENRFVIAKKLFVTINKKDDDDTQVFIISITIKNSNKFHKIISMLCLFQQNLPLTVQYIERNFRKFGQIVSIEILSKELGEAYVTFVSDLNAYLALAHSEVSGRRTSLIFNIKPADTWTQPSVVVTNNPENTTNQIDDEQLPAFLMLNEYCILEICKYLDLDSLVNLSMVCKILHRLLYQHCFPRYRTYSIQNDKSSIPMPLAKVRQTLICIGPHLTDLYFKWHDYDHDDRLQRFLDKLGQLVGRNIRRMRFHQTLLESSHIPAIQPILKHLDTLEMVVYNPDFELDLDFTVLCPNLRRLKLLENMQLLHVSAKPWPTLDYFSTIGNEYMELNAFRSFLANNPQLQCLKFTAFSADDRLQAVAQNAKNLRKLTIFPSFPNLCASNVIYLSSLQHLTKLSLINLEENDLNGILDCLIRFTGLRSIKLFLSYDSHENENDTHFIPNQRTLISLAQELPHLEKFSTRYVTWKETTILDFIQNASQLNAMHIHWCDLSITNAMLWKIVKVLQSNRPQPSTMPLQLYVNPEDVIGLQMIDGPEILRHLNVHTKCNHFEKGE